MPQVAAFIAYAYEAIAAWVAANEFAALVIFTIASLAVETYLAKRMSGLNLGDNNQGQFVVVRGTVEVDQIAYGETRKGGVLMFLDVSGEQNDYLYQVIHIFGHECDSILSIFFDEQQIFPSDFNSTGDVINGYYAGRVSIHKYLGTAAQLADPMLVAAFSADGRWTATDRSRGNTYIVVRMLRDDPTNDAQVKVFATGAPGTITSVVKGMKVYDPRSDSTAGGSGTQRQTDRTTWVWNDNSALCCCNYLILGNSTTPTDNLGFAEPWENINIAELTAAATRCDALVNFTTTAGTVTLRQFTCNGIIDTSATLADTKDNLEASMFGKVFWSGGQWHFFAGGYDTPTLTLSEKDFGGDFSFLPLSQHSDRSNSVHAVYPDSEQAFKSNECQEMLNAQYAIDDGETLELTIKLPFTNLELTAQYISWLTMQQTRNMAQFTAVMKPSAIQVRAWDVVFFNIAMFNWVNKPFRCISWKNGDLGLPQLQFKAEDPNLYGWTANTAKSRSIPAYVPPTIETPPPPTSLTGTPIPGGVYLYWTNPAISSFEYIQIIAGTTGQTVDTGTVVDKVIANSYSFPTGTTFQYWVRAVNKYGGKSKPAPNSSTGITVVPGAAGLDSGTLTLIGRNGVVTTPTSMKKTSGPQDWLSDGYSLQTFTGGCALSFQVSQTNAAIMVGLNSDPSTDASYTSLDYAFYLQNDGNFSIFESGAEPAAFGAYTVSDTFVITYDGATLRYYHNKILLRLVNVVNASFSVDSSFYQLGEITDISFTSASQAPNAINLVARGTCQVVGTSVQKVGGNIDWDSDCYSVQGYVNGAFVSWTVPDVTADFMMGLDSNPSQDTSFGSMDYALQCSGGTAVVYESGALAFIGPTYGNNSTFSVQYDGLWVRYYCNEVLFRSVATPNRTFYMDSSFYSPGSVATNIAFGAQTTLTPALFIGRGGCVCTSATIHKLTAGTTLGWGTSDAYSLNGYAQCHLFFKTNDLTGVDYMVGLNTDPTLDMDYTGIDYAWHQSSGNGNWLLMYESGVHVGTVSRPVLSSDLIGITYNGNAVIYWLNGVAMRTVVDPGKVFFVDSSFYTPGSGINSINWGPTVNQAVTDTPQLGSNAATNLYFAQDDSPQTATWTGMTHIPTTQLGLNYVASPILTFTAPLTGNAIVTLMTQVYLSQPSSATTVPAAYALVVVLDNGLPTSSNLVDYFPKSGIPGFGAFNNIGGVNPCGFVAMTQTSPQGFSTHGQVSLTEGHSYSVYLCAQVDSATTTGHFYSTEMQVEYIKK